MTAQVLAIALAVSLAVAASAEPARAQTKCKADVAAARAELQACEKDANARCSTARYDALAKSKPECLATINGKALTKLYDKVKRVAAEADLQSKLRSAAEAVELARVGELAETLEIANFARAALVSHRDTYGGVSPATEAAAAKLEAALAKRKPDLAILQDKGDVASKAIVKTGRFTAQDALDPTKVAQVWALVSRARLVKVRAQMNSSLQQFVWAPVDGVTIPLKGDRSATPSFELRDFGGDEGVQMKVVVAWGALLSIGTPLLVWEADLGKPYFVAVTPDGTRFHVPYVTKDGDKTYKSVEPLGEGKAKPRFRPWRHVEVPAEAVAVLGRAGILDAKKVEEFTAARQSAVTCYTGAVTKLKAAVDKLRAANKNDKADKLAAEVPDKAMARCKKKLKPVAKLYKGLMRSYRAGRVKAFDRIKTLFDVPAPRPKR